MSTKQFTFGEWVKALRKSSLSDNLFGVTPRAAAERLGVSSQRVHQLIQEERLDVIRVNDANGHPAILLITEASLQAHKPRAVGAPGHFAKALRT